MNVLMISLDNTPFTGEKRGDFLQRLLKYAKCVDHITCLIYTPDKGYKTKTFGNIKLVPTQNFHPVFFPMVCVDLAKKEKFDLVVTQDVEACGEAGRRIKQRFKVPLVCNLFTLKPKNAVMEWISERVIKSADLVRCESQVQHEWLRQQGFKGQIVVSPIGFDLEKFKPPKTRKAKNTVLYVGRLSREKNVGMILKAAKIMDECKFVIVGSGNEEAKLKLLARGLKNVKFAGLVPHDKLKKYFDSANMLVLTSRFEGVPSVIVEAMSNGLPIISTDLPDIQAIITNNKEGFLIGQDDVDSLIDRINILVKSPQQATIMGNAGRRRVLSLFGGDNVVKTVVDGWQSVLQKSGCVDSNDHVTYCERCNK